MQMIGYEKEMKISILYQNPLYEFSYHLRAIYILMSAGISGVIV